MSDELELLLEAVSEAAALAGSVARMHFGSRLRVEEKPDGSPVTVADREAERRVVEWVERRFPNDGIVGEEFGAVRPDARRRWLIDPIDGTKSFVRGVPLWGSLVAVAEGDTVLAGAAAFPALAESLSGAMGRGAWWNGVRCRVSSISSLAEAAVLTTDSRFVQAPQRVDGWRRLAAAAGLARDWGDCYGYLLVATGRAEVMVDAILADWDCAALFPAVVEAGGVFTDFNGRPTAFGRNAIATNAALARDSREMLGAPLSEAR